MKEKKTVHCLISICLCTLPFTTLCFNPALQERLEKIHNSRKESFKERTERLQREKAERQKEVLAQQETQEKSPLNEPVSQPATPLTAPAGTATLSEKPTQSPTHEKITEQAIKPQSTKPKPRPKPASKPPQQPKPREKADVQPPTDLVTNLVAQPSAPIKEPTSETAPSKPRPQQPQEQKVPATSISLPTSEGIENNERKLSLKLFSILIPTLASYNTDKLFGDALEKDTVANQKHALATIQAFIKKLTDKLKKIDNKQYYAFLGSPSFKNQAWTSELFSRLTAVYLFCVQHLKQYQNREDKNSQPENIKELTQQFTSTIKLLEQLCERYFKYSLP